MIFLFLHINGNKNRKINKRNKIIYIIWNRCNIIYIALNHTKAIPLIFGQPRFVIFLFWECS